MIKIKYYKSGERYTAIMPDGENFIKVYDYMSFKSVHAGNNAGMVRDVEMHDKAIDESEFREVMERVVEFVSAKVEFFTTQLHRIG